MARLITLYSLQWGDLPLEEVRLKAKEFGYDGLELGLTDHLDVRQTDMPSVTRDRSPLSGKTARWIASRGRASRVPSPDGSISNLPLMRSMLSLQRINQ